MRLLPAIVLLLAATPATAQSQRETFTCTAEASAAGLTAQTRRLLDGRGDLRSGVTIIGLPLTGTIGILQASWEVRQGLPEVARGKYLFRLPPSSDATWQVVGTRKPVRAKNGLLTLDGEQFGALLASRASIQLVLAGRDGRTRARASVDRSAFDAAVNLARQSDARALARAYDYRSCPRGK